ncbi:MAG: chemotaxis protein CheA [Lachnospiraceae bacterium]|nr:chemotaxis protein CheA [Lachnospiraceae bacterium]
MDTSQYLEIFIDETKEHLQSLSDHFMVLEKEPDNADTINEIFRSAHTLKGMAGTMGFVNMQNLTHKMEDVFSVIRDGNMKVTPDLVDLLFRGLDALEAYQDNIINTSAEGDETNKDIVDALIAMKEGKAAPAKQDAPAEKPKEEEAPKATTSVAAGSGDDSLRKYRDISFADFEKNAIKEADDQKKNVYGITVYIQENCLLKAARAFLVFKELEVLGEVVKSVPTVQDIEDEKFELDFSVVLITDAAEKAVVDAIMTVSEIDKVSIEKLDVNAVVNGGAEVRTEESSKGADSDSSDVQQAKPQAAAAAKQAKDDKKAQPKSSGKAVVNRSVRVDIEKLDDLMNQVSELIIAKNGLVSVSESDAAATDSQSFTEQIEYLERITTTLHESIMKVRMVPIESVVNRFPRMIRDLSKKLNKPMELYMSGEDTELDRTVIDEIGDPLMHLLRNSADHGIEDVARRKELGKPEQGSIYLNASQVGNNVVIEVKDDGGGIDVERVREKAIERGTITEEQAEVMEDKDIIDLLFLPSFSTAKEITDVSGRGVGLDVVRSKIEGLGGDIEVRTKKDEGSVFTIRLPLTLAIIQALMIELGDEKYAIPLNSIETIEDVAVSDIKYVKSKEVIHLRGTVIPLVRLYDLLDFPPREETDDNITVVIVSKGDKQAGLIVDNLIGQQEIVIKPLGKYINIEKIISGATILGDGEVALILDANALV